MHRLILTVGEGFEVVAAAAASIVLTVLAITKTVLTVHADQSGWDATATTPRRGSEADDSTRENGGVAAWV
ncbi:hypothetical protein [Haloplanus natans]|uniref:hypothetical protein n=1 Tax=Haloplanus natans TaxID=376171 RepID=UPI000677E9D4|nr:hypothetical protein [Haloplanus natans]